MRKLSLSVQSAGHSRATSERLSAGGNRASETGAHSAGPPGAAAKVLPAPEKTPRLPPPPAPTRPKEESSSEYSEESGEEGERSVREERTTPNRSRQEEIPTPPSPPPRPREVRERSRRRRGHRAESSRVDRKKTRRAGRKHQRLYRTLERPDLKVHHRIPGSFFEGHSGREDSVNPSDL